jgi:aldehyde dehydrogenase (NAD+)
MKADEACRIVSLQRRFHQSGATRSLDFRRDQLLKLKRALVEHEEDIFKALHSDLGRPDTESFFGETLFVMTEVDSALRNLSGWSRPNRVPTPLMMYPGSSLVYPEPYGVSLIIGPWNYPFQLMMAPLIGAIAAGNCAVLKPSEISEHTSSLIAGLLGEIFEPSFVAVVEGDREAVTSLLNERFDYIFYTGSAPVGRIVMEAAARHLTPSTLELGGKSPCIVDRSLHLEPVVKRIAWGKFFNAGQTCVAPDYMLVRKELKEEVVSGLLSTIKAFYGEDPSRSRDYSRIINRRHLSRLTSLLSEGKPLCGGVADEESLYLAPTLLDEVTWESPCMKEEIFGPILPVLSYDSIDGAIEEINRREKPLALYLFTEDEDIQNRVIAETSSGGVCINDTIVHIGTPHLPFGGVGESGMGAYHGKATFDIFSHRKSVMRRSLVPDPAFRYPPYAKLTAMFRKIMTRLIQ